MKRYDLIEYPACGTHDKMMDERPDGDWCSFEEVQALLRAVAEEARKMKHEEHCPAVICEECGCGKDRTWHVPSDDPDDYCRFSPEGDCECGRGKVLAMLEVEK